MHELGITQNIVAIVTEHAQGKKVKRVVLEVGKLSAIMPEAIRFCFDICSQGTILAEALLEIREITGRGKCCQCGTEINLTIPFVCNACGSRELDIIAGEELTIKEIEIEEICV